MFRYWLLLAALSGLVSSVYADTLRVHISDRAALVRARKTVGAEPIFWENGSALFDVTEQQKRALLGCDGVSAAEPSTGMSRKNFPTLYEVTDRIESYAGGYDFCRLDTAGQSSEGRPIQVLRIDETGGKGPLVFISGSTHGNEKVGTACVTAFLDSLLTAPEWEALRKRYRFTVVPILSPDGYAAHSRYLAGRIDPNRQFGWQGGYYNTSGWMGDDHSVCSEYPLSPPELQAYQGILMEDPWFISLDYHTGVEAVIAPWFADVPMVPVDADEFRTLTQTYLTEVSLDRGLEFGGWMEQDGIPGVQGDYPYVRCGTYSLVPEIHNTQAQQEPADLSRVCADNTKGLKTLFERADRGFSAVLTDSGGAPLYGRVSFHDGAFPVWSSPVSGTFYKYSESQVKSITADISVAGYADTTVQLQNRTPFQADTIILRSRANASFHAQNMEAFRAHNRPEQAQMHCALGAPDDQSLDVESTEHSSFATFSFGPEAWICDRSGADITVYSTNSGEYTLYGARNITGLIGNSGGVDLGSAAGTASFDLSDVDADSLRYLKVVPQTGAVVALDAISIMPPEESEALTEVHSASSGMQTVVAAGGRELILRNVQPGRAVLFNLQGKVLRRKNISGNTGRIATAGLSRGVYLLQMENSLCSRTIRVNLP
ncbi:MAG: M14 family zinc carboxypeptidase [Fibrobacterota bacterium]